MATPPGLIRVPKPPDLGRAAAILAITAAGCGIEFWLELLSPQPVSGSEVLVALLACLVILPPLAFGSMGLLIVSRAADRTIGWVMCAIGVLFSLGFVFTDAPPYLYRHHVTGAAVLVPAVVGTYIWIPFVVSVVSLLLLFPTGRPLPGLWGRVLPWGITAITLSLAVAAVTPGKLAMVPLQNPLALPFIPSYAAQLLAVATVILLFLGVAAIIERFRRSRGEERQQLKWFTYSAAITVLFFLGAFTNTLVGNLLSIGYFVFITMIPVAIGIAVLKYRLYDIDVLINRTLVYGAATISLAAAYASGVLGLQALFRVVAGQGGDLAVACVTLAVAALFNPWRRRVQSFIDRRFYRRKYDGARALAALQRRMRDEVDLDTLIGDVAAVVVESVHPAHLSLWLRESAE